MGKLTTHILDTAHGRPAAGVRIELYRLDEAGELRQSSPEVEATTNDDGRCDRPLLSESQWTEGRYRLVFHAGDYFRALGLELPDPAFLDRVVIDFGVSDRQFCRKDEI